MNEQPIPNNASQPIDIDAMASRARDMAKAIREKVTAPPPISIADANARFGFIHCVVCGAGGHTGHTLYTIIENVVTMKEGKACATHVVQYVRPKDLKKKRRDHKRP